METGGLRRRCKPVHDCGQALSQLYDPRRNEKNIGALIKGEPVWVRVDAFNENGVSEGGIFALQQTPLCHKKHRGEIIPY